MATLQLTTNNVSELMTKLAGYQMLPRLKKEMIIDRAISSIECSLEEITTACEQFYLQNQLTDANRIDAWCAHHAIGKEQLEALAIRQLKINKFKEIQFGHQVGSCFMEQKDRLDRVNYSLIRTKNLGLAQELYFRILEGEQTFGELARKYSEGMEAQSYGFITSISVGTLHPLMARKLLTSQPGHLLAPIQIEGWVVIVRLEQLIPAQLDDGMRQRLLHELFNSWLHEQMNSENTEF